MKDIDMTETFFEDLLKESNKFSNGISLHQLDI